VIWGNISGQQAVLPRALVDRSPACAPDSTVPMGGLGVFSSRSAQPRIIAAARLLLQQQNLNLPTIQDVAAASGLSRRAVYNHFRGPEDLRAAVLHSLFEEIEERIPPEIALQLDPEPAIAGFLSSCAELMLSDAYLQAVRLLVASAEVDAVTASAYRRNVRQPMIRPVEMYLLQRKVMGEFRRCESRSAAEQLVAMIECATVMPVLLHLREPEAGLDAGAIRVIASSFLAAHL
jgi:AcrR family transcriptional regulator